MKMKVVRLDEDLVQFALQRCEADEKLGKLVVRGTRDLATGRKCVDYLVKVRRLRDALEKATDA